MKKKLLSIFAVMLAVFSVQAQEVILDFTSNAWGIPTSKTVTQGTYTNNGYSVTLTGSSSNGYAWYNDQKYLLLGKKGATLALPAFDFAVSKIEVVGRTGASGKVTTNIYVGETVVSTQVTGSTGTAKYEISPEYQAAGNIYVFKVTNANNAQITKINIYKAESAGEGGGETPDPDQPETPEAPAAPTLTASCNFDGSMNVEITNIAEGATAYYTTDGTVPTAASTKYTVPFEITATTTVKAVAVNEGGSSEVVTETYTKNEPVTPPAEGQVVDVLNRALTGITTTSYSNWSGKTVTSDAVYAGNSAGDYESIQLRSNNSNSGIVTTQSGGKAKKVVVVWNSNTASNRTLDVYGKNSAYAAATDLYSASTQGTKIGSIVYGASTELTIDGDYEYIGLRSASGAMYLTSISITWDASAGVTVVPDAPALPASANFENEFEVAITAEDGATIYYTTDGAEPTTESTVYSAPFTISETTTVKAIAVKDDVVSTVAEAKYTKVRLIDLSNCTVAEAIEAYKNGQAGTATITAYIVGAANGGLSKAEFTSETAVLTNILIADNADETNVDNCMPIKMANGTAVRNALNLGENKNVYKKKVVIVGELEAYFSVAGMQDVEKAGLYWTVSDAGYATLYLGYKAEIPSTVKAYIVASTTSTHVIMSEIEGVVAANTGLILEGEGEHLFNITAAATTADVKGNLLKGTVAATEIEEEAYVLGVVDDEVGLYKAEMNGGVWLNNANKAYLPASAVANKSAQFFGFDWNGTTGIEEVATENVEVKTIFDLTGRRVEEITAPGIYIVNGKKVFVK